MPPKRDSRRIARRIALIAVLAVSLGVPAAAAGRGHGDGFSFGVVPQGGIDTADTQLMRDGGVESVRLWFNWAEIEGEPRIYDFSRLDAMVAAVAVHGIEPLPYLFGMPRWATAADGGGCEGADCIPFAPRSDLTRAAFGAFAGAAVRRYGPGGEFWADHPGVPYVPIRSWQIWNEQNLPDFYRPGVDVASYGALLSAAAQAIRGADPGAEVVVGGMWGPRSAPKQVVPTVRYLRSLYRLEGIEQSFDAIALHPYAGRVASVLEQIEAVRKTARRSGDGGVGVYVTELGWASGGPRREALVKTPRKQAKLLRRTFGTLYRKRRTWRIRGAYWYAWRDTARDAGVCNWCPQAGLHSVAGVAKPAWGAFRRVALR